MINIPTTFTFLFHRKRALSHEARIGVLEKSASTLHSDVKADRAVTISTMKVLSDEVTRLDGVSQRLQRFGV